MSKVSPRATHQLTWGEHHVLGALLTYEQDHLILYIINFVAIRSFVTVSLLRVPADFVTVLNQNPGSQSSDSKHRDDRVANNDALSPNHDLL